MYYLQLNTVLTDEDGGSKIFVTIPRFQPGSPITLGTVSDKKVDGQHLITPYPSWEWHRNPEQCNVDRLITVYRVQVCLNFIHKIKMNTLHKIPYNIIRSCIIRN